MKNRLLPHIPIRTLPLHGTAVALALSLTLGLPSCSSPEQELDSNQLVKEDAPAGFVLDRPISEVIRAGEPTVAPSAFENEAPNSPESNAGDTAADSGHLLLLVRSNGERFEVARAQRVDEPLPRPRGGAVAKAWEIRARDASGQALALASIDNPHLEHSEFRANDDEGNGTGPAESVDLEAEEAVFTIRVPLGSRAIDFVRRDPSLARAEEDSPVRPRLAIPQTSSETLLGRAEISAHVIEEDDKR